MTITIRMVYQRLKTLGTYLGLGVVLVGMLGGSLVFMQDDVSLQSILVDEKKCANERTGIYQTEVRLGSVETTSDSLEAEIIHFKPDTVEVTGFKFSRAGKIVLKMNESIEIPPGDSRTVSFEEFKPSDSCITYNMSIFYSSSEITGQKASGKLKVAAETGQN